MKLSHNHRTPEYLRERPIEIAQGLVPYGLFADYTCYMEFFLFHP
jgi:hypothetical protein